MDEKTKSRHERMVAGLVKYLIKDGYINIRADLSGFDPPDYIYCGNVLFLVPDITGVKNGWGQIFMVGTADSINKDYTATQWICFGSHAKRFNKSFIIVVPEAVKSDVKELLQSFGVSAGVWSV